MKMKFQKRGCLLFLLLSLLSTGCGVEKSANVKTEESTITEENAAEQQMQEQTSEGEGVESPEQDFPILLEEGKLALKSIFQSSIPNPDKGFEEAVDVASIELLNQSEAYLKKADITLTLEDGTLLTFQICDIPAGKTVWAFDVANTSITNEHPYNEVACQAEFDEVYNGWDGQFEVNSEVATVELTNLTGEEQKDLKVKFHCVMEDLYFGGTSYEYRIEKLAHEETAVLEVMECYFGEAEAVRIIYE